MFLQGTLWGSGHPSITASAPIARIQLDATSWIEHSPAWLAGADEVFDSLVRDVPWRQRRDVPMYDRLVDEPRLSWWWRLDAGADEPLPVLADVRHWLSSRYGVVFDSIGFNLYRDGRDSVAWHGDRHRHHVVDPVVAIVSVGARRPLRLRARRRGEDSGLRSRSWDLGDGDLFVMGGACQHDWEHCVPKVRVAGPRLSITFRHDAASTPRGPDGPMVPSG